ncbi:cytochrome c oxidase assembly protein cox19 [Lipomyces doorenjongii]|uniref:cytochrome c oxidase assembly protein cox19 n=1 Tax=Lipomyces doorenjongii TaxID=383834 RepID=UPI0034CD19A0
MSFGGASGNTKVFKPTPPDRGSFPLDHDGECKIQMQIYLDCLRSSRSRERVPADCRLLAKEYLNCRMERGLMLKDNWVNLGLPDDKRNSSTDSPESKS